MSKTTANEKTTAKRAAAGKRSAKKRATKRKVSKKKAASEKAPRKKQEEALPDEAIAEGAPAGEAAVESAPASDDDRRTQQRHDLPAELEVEVELFGYLREGRQAGIGPAPNPQKKFQTFGTTVNLSLGGMLARVGEAVSEGSHCLVRFIDAGDFVRPPLRWGLVLRSTLLEEGCEVAVRFDSPLEFLDAAGLPA